MAINQIITLVASIRIYFKKYSMQNRVRARLQHNPECDMDGHEDITNEFEEAVRHQMDLMRKELFVEFDKRISKYVKEIEKRQDAKICLQHHTLRKRVERVENRVKKSNFV